MKAIIIGATSGIGRELAKQLSEQGVELGITGRRSELLDTLEVELQTNCYKLQMDLLNVSKTKIDFIKLLEKMDGVDIVIINSGTLSNDPEESISGELETIGVNVVGFTIIANLSYHYFSQRNKGHIVGISSIAGLRGAQAVSYNASKAFVSTYLEGLSCRLYSRNKNVFITDVRPGFVDTKMALGDGVFWMSSTKKAVNQIIKAINKKRRVVYITKRWNIIAPILYFLPFSIYKRLICR
ncbi:MAG: oxidoreductase [Planctomycetota bacterium]|nr:MAG: oxidoreductase [Planctomycetota bacterium]